MRASGSGTSSSRISSAHGCSSTSIDVSEDVAERFARSIGSCAVRRGPRRAAADRRSEQDRSRARAAAVELDDPRVLRIHAVSCATGAGIDELKRSLFELCPAAPRAGRRGARSSSTSSSTGRVPPPRRRYRIFRTDRGFRVEGDAPGGDELEQALRAAGVRTGRDGGGRRRGARVRMTARACSAARSTRRTTATSRWPSRARAVRARAAARARERLAAAQARRR